MKKLIATITAAAMLAALAAVLGGPQMSGVKAAEATDDGFHYPDESNLGKSNLKVALLTSPSGTDDLAVNRGLKQGIDDFLESDKTVKVKSFVEKTGKPEAALKMAEEAAAEHDVVVMSGEAFAGAGEVAKKFPNVHFIVFDAVPRDRKGAPAVIGNVTSFTYRDEEAGFLAGVAAALESKSGKVAAVTAKDSGTVAANGKLGFACGVNYANKHYGTSVKVPVSDHEMTAAQLIADGCDILFAASPSCVKDVLRAAKAADGVRVIGSFIDLFPYGGSAKNNVVITSVYRTQGGDLMGELLTVVLENAKGENKVLGAYDYSINYYFDTERSNLSDKTDETLMKVFELLGKGKIVPASLSNGMTADAFTGL